MPEPVKGVAESVLALLHVLIITVIFFVESWFLFWMYSKLHTGSSERCIENSHIGKCHRIESRQNTHQMLPQMSAGMWQVPPPPEEAAVAAARLRAKEEAEQAQAEQARLQKEADEAQRKAEEKRLQTEASVCTAESARESAAELHAQMQTDQTKMTERLRIEQEKKAKRQEEEAKAEEQRRAEEAEFLRAKAEEEALGQAQLADLADELRRVQDHQCRGVWLWLGGVGGVLGVGLGQWSKASRVRLLWGEVQVGWAWRGGQWSGVWAG